MLPGFEAARAHSRHVVIEQHFQGHDHRVLVVAGEVVAVAERVPAQVVGDGTRSIEAALATPSLKCTSAYEPGSSSLLALSTSSCASKVRELASIALEVLSSLAV